MMAVQRVSTTDSLLLLCRCATLQCVGGRRQREGSSSNGRFASASLAAMAVAASFDTSIATQFGDVIGTEANNLALQVLEGLGMNLARNPTPGSQL